MHLSPVDVREVEFASARRGYDEQQVDDFLDRVVVALEERDAALAGRPAVPGDVVDLFAMAQRTAEEHVTAAQRAALELRAQAEQDAARLVATARSAAAAELQELYRERDRLERRVEELQRLTADARAGLEAYLTGVFQVVRGAEADGAAALPLSA